MNPYLVALVAVGLLLGGSILLLDRLALATIRPPRKVRGRRLDALPFHTRPHAFTSLGQPLRGWVVEPARDGGGTVVVLAHGWGSSHGRMTHLAEPLLRAGHPVFLFDVRHHGNAPDAPFVTARHFRDDILAATREAALLFPDRPRALVGHSMGGAAAILAVAEGAPVHGLVSLAAPAELWEVWAHHFDRRGLPGKWLVRLLSPFWRVRAGVPFRALRPARRVQEISVPFLIIHGQEDESVPVSHAHELARAAGREAVVLHAESHSGLLESHDLHARVLAFLSTVAAP